MLDWLIEVTTAFKCRNRIYYLAVRLFNEFLVRSSEKLENEDVHGIGIASLYLASKYEDGSLLSAEVISKQISHDIFSAEDINARELLMLCALEFNLELLTHFDLH